MKRTCSEINSLFRSNLPRSWKQFRVLVKLGVVGLSLFNNLINGSEQHMSNRNNSTLVATAFFDGKVAISDFWMKDYLIKSNRFLE